MPLSSTSRLNTSKPARTNDILAKYSPYLPVCRWFRSAQVFMRSAMTSCGRSAVALSRATCKRFLNVGGWVQRAADAAVGEVTVANGPWRSTLRGEIVHKKISKVEQFFE